MWNKSYMERQRALMWDHIKKLESIMATMGDDQSWAHGGRTVYFNHATFEHRVL